MTKREQEQLERLLAKKRTEEQHDHDFFAEVRRRRAEVLRVLDVNVEVVRMIQTRAVEIGVSERQLCDAMYKIRPEWIKQSLSHVPSA